MNLRYFSRENEFGSMSRFASAPTALAFVEEITPVDDDDELWLPEVMQAQTVQPDGIKRIGNDESWIELSWNLHHRLAWLTLHAQNFDQPLPMWQRQIAIPEMEHESDVDLIRHLTMLANLLYSLYAATEEALDLVTPMMDTLLDFRQFLEGLED